MTPRTLLEANWCSTASLFVMLLKPTSCYGSVISKRSAAIAVQPCSVPARAVRFQQSFSRAQQLQRFTVHAGPAEKQVVSKGGWWTKDNPSNMKEVTTPQELVNELADAGDKLVVVEYYAPWCNACKALFPKICKLMEQNKEKIVFLKVSFEDCKEMCKTMGVKVLPFFHFYRGGEGRVDAFSCTISKIQRFKDAIETHTSEFCSLQPPPGIPEFPDVRPYPDGKPAATT